MAITNTTVLKAIRDVADTLDHSTSAMNSILQFTESYVAKAVNIRKRIYEAERDNLLTLVGSLAARNITAEVAEITKAYIEAEAMKKCHAYATASKFLDTISNSVRVIFGVTQSSSVLKTVLGTADDPKVN